jgi:hypothetical protein
VVAAVAAATVIATAESIVPLSLEFSSWKRVSSVGDQLWDSFHIVRM